MWPKVKKAETHKAISDALASGVLTSSRCDELIAAAEARHREIVTAVRPSESITTRDQLVANASPEAIVEADRDLELLEAEAEILYEQLHHLRAARETARRTEAPELASKALAMLPPKLKATAGAVAKLATVRAELDAVVSDLRQHLALVPPGERRSVAPDAETFEQVAELLGWNAHAKGVARTALCGLTQEQEDSLASDGMRAPVRNDDVFMERDGRIVKVGPGAYSKRKAQGYVMIKNGEGRWRAQNPDADRISTAVALNTPPRWANL